MALTCVDGPGNDPANNQPNLKDGGQMANGNMEQAEVSENEISFWKRYDWSKYCAREFVTSVLIMMIASVFVLVITLRTEGVPSELLWWWTATVGGVAAWWMSASTVQKANNLKANVEAMKTGKFKPLR